MRSYDVGPKTLSGYDLHANKTPVFQYKGQYSTHLFTNKTIDVIKRHDKTKVRLRGQYLKSSFPN